MKTLSTLLIVALLFPLATIAAEPNAESSPQQQAILKAEEEFFNASKAGDVKRLEAVLADDFTLGGPTGNIMEREEYVSAVREKVLVLESGKLDEVKVRVYGDAAVVTGVMIVSGKHGDFDFSGNYRVTDTLIKHDGKWQKVAGQMTPIH